MGDNETLLRHGGENRRGRGCTSCHHMDWPREREDSFILAGIHYGVEDHRRRTEVCNPIIGYC